MGRRMWSPRVIVTERGVVEADPGTPGWWQRLERAVGEAALLARLTVSLTGHLLRAPSYRWLWMLVRLLAFSTLLLPGFFRMVVWYFTSKRVMRNVAYSPKPRNLLDVYSPESLRRTDPAARRPVLVFVTGGAWIIGYKAWGALLCRRLSKQGMVVVSLDYRNFPQGTVGDMVDDVELGMEWVYRNVHLYGGDRERIYLVGQSAGAHISALALMRRAFGAPGVARVSPQASKLVGQNSSFEISWRPETVRAFVGVSGAYNLRKLEDHVTERGLSKNIFNIIMSKDGQPELEVFSPALVVGDAPFAPNGSAAPAARSLPPFLLIHGTADQSIPYAHAVDFAQRLRASGVQVELKLLNGETHTTPFIENPMKGDDKLTEILLRLALGRGPADIDMCMVPHFLARAATLISPF